MDDLLMWLAGIGMMAVIGVVYFYLEGRRSKAMAAACEAAGFTFDRSPEGFGGAELGGMALFRSGSDREVHNLWQGEIDGVPFRLFDYEYTTGQGDVTINKRTVCAWPLGDATLPAFEAFPEKIDYVIGEMVGQRDFDFDDSPRFSRRYVLRGVDEQAVRALFHREIRNHLEGLRGVSVEGQGGWIIVHRPRKKVKPKRATRLLEEAKDIRRVFEAGMPVARSESVVEAEPVAVCGD